MKGSNAERPANIFSDGVCIVCDGSAKNGANIMNVDSTYVRICNTCFERLWKELCQENSAAAIGGEGREREEQVTC